MSSVKAEGPACLVHFHILHTRDGACARLMPHCLCAKLFRSCPTLCDPVDCSPPGSSLHVFSRQEYWSGLPCLFAAEVDLWGTTESLEVQPSILRDGIYEQTVARPRINTHPKPPGGQLSCYKQQTLTAFVFFMGVVFVYFHNIYSCGVLSSSS